MTETCAPEAGSNPPIPAENPELYPEDGFARLVEAERDHFWFRERAALLTWCAQRYFPDTTSYFEVGCGTGGVLRSFAEQFPSWKISAVEYFESAAGFVRTQLGDRAEITCADARDLSLFGRFDLVGSFDVLEHIEEDVEVIREVADTLKPEGGFIITVPQHQCLWSARDDEGGHKRRYSRSEMIEKLTNNGFEIVMVSSFVTFLFPVMWLSRLVSRSSADKSRSRELKINPLINTILAIPLKLERFLIRLGVSLPFGGSLLVVARRPSNKH